MPIDKEYLSMSTEQEVTEIVTSSREEFLNSETLHIPSRFMRDYVTESGTWTLNSSGISQPVNCSLYPNPLNSKTFLDRSGDTKEIVGDDYYFFHGYALFEYKGRAYGGGIDLEINFESRTITLNGEIVQ
jgi:hypothetical protein